MKPVFKTHGSLILASASPRRKAFLEDLGLVFSVQAANIDESGRQGEDPSSFVRRIAFEKAAAVATSHPGAWILAADTVVVLGKTILGKPEGSEDAVAMLLHLAGQQHEVWTGFCLRDGAATVVQRQIRTLVRFRQFTEEACRAYVQCGEPLDKAGAYGIQGVGGFLVAGIEGSYSNVVGLPLAEVTEEMEKLGIISPATLC